MDLFQQDLVRVRELFLNCEISVDSSPENITAVAKMTEAYRGFLQEARLRTPPPGYTKIKVPPVPKPLEPLSSDQELLAGLDLVALKELGNTGGLIPGKGSMPSANW